MNKQSLIDAFKSNFGHMLGPNIIEGLAEVALKLQQKPAETYTYTAVYSGNGGALFDSITYDTPHEAWRKSMDHPDQIGIMRTLSAGKTVKAIEFFARGDILKRGQQCLDEI
jgi:hypothetical protein